MSALLLAQVSDSHLYENEAGALRDRSGNVVCVTASTLRQVLADVRGLDPRPELLLLTGDLSHDGSAASYRRLKRWLAEVGIPYHWTPGNHDCPRTMAAELSGWSAQVRCGAWNVVLLNSKVPQEGAHHGEVSADALEELGGILSTQPLPTLIALHHPPLDVGSRWLDEKYPLRNATNLRQWIGQFPHVKVVVFGHAHQELDREVEGVRYLGAPSTCDQFVPQTEVLTRDELPPGYRLLWLHDNGSIDTEVIRLRRA